MDAWFQISAGYNIISSWLVPCTFKKLVWQASRLSGGSLLYSL